MLSSSCSLSSARVMSSSSGSISGTGPRRFGILTNSSFLVSGGGAKTLTLALGSRVVRRSKVFKAEGPDAMTRD